MPNAAKPGNRGQAWCMYELVMDGVLPSGRKRRRFCSRREVNPSRSRQLRRANGLVGAPSAEVRGRKFRFVNRVTIIVGLNILLWVALFGVLRLLNII